MQQLSSQHVSQTAQVDAEPPKPWSASASCQALARWREVAQLPNSPAWPSPTCSSWASNLSTSDTSCAHGFRAFLTTLGLLNIVGRWRRPALGGARHDTTVAEVWPPSGCSTHLPQKRCTLKCPTSDGGFEPGRRSSPWLSKAMATWPFPIAQNTISPGPFQQGLGLLRDKHPGKATCISSEHRISAEESHPKHCRFSKLGLRATIDVHSTRVASIVMSKEHRLHLSKSGIQL